MNKWKSRLEVGSSLLMIGAAGTLLYSLLAPRGGQEWAERDLHVEMSELRNTRGSGETVLVMFSDYECPYCATFHRDVFPAVQERLSAGLGTKFAMVNFPLEKIHPYARPAAEATECAGKQGKYWEMFDALFLASPDLGRERILSEAQKVELEAGRFTACLGGEQSAAITADVDLSRRFGVTATPSFFIGRVEGNSVRITSGYEGVPTVEGITSAIRRAEGKGWRRFLPWS